MPRICSNGFVALLMSISLLGTGIIAEASRADSPDTKLIINSAVYGNLDDDKTVNVTGKVSAMITDNSLSVAATPANFGDPAPNSMKKLKVGYTVGGVYRSKTVDEGETLDISTRLVILKAVYAGVANGPSADVTEQVADLVRKNMLSVKADNETFGDPANGVVKKLSVEYLYDGVKKTATAAEGATINLPEKRG